MGLYQINTFTFTPTISPMTALPLISTYSNPCPMASRFATVCGDLSKTGPAIVGSGVVGSTPVCTSPSMASLHGAAWGTSWVAALLCFGQGSHQFHNLLPQLCGSLPGVSGHCCPSSYFVPDFLIFTFCLWVATINMQVRSPGGAVEIPDGILNMFVDPQKRQSLRCCWTSRSIILSGHCSLIWLRVPSSIVAVEGTFSWLPWVTL